MWLQAQHQHSLSQLDVQVLTHQSECHILLSKVRQHDGNPAESKLAAAPQMPDAVSQVTCAPYLCASFDMLWPSVSLPQKLHQLDCAHESARSFVCSSPDQACTVAIPSAAVPGVTSSLLNRFKEASLILAANLEMSSRPFTVSGITPVPGF